MHEYTLDFSTISDAPVPSTSEAQAVVGEPAQSTRGEVPEPLVYASGAFLIALALIGYSGSLNKGKY